MPLAVLWLPVVLLPSAEDPLAVVERRHPRLETGDQLFNGLRLVAGRLKRRYKLKWLVHGEFPNAIRDFRTSARGNHLLLKPNRRGMLFLHTGGTDMKRRISGYTLIELVISLAVSGTLMGIAVPSMLSAIYAADAGEAGLREMDAGRSARHGSGPLHRGDR